MKGGEGLKWLEMEQISVAIQKLKYLVAPFWRQIHENAPFNNVLLRKCAGTCPIEMRGQQGFIKSGLTIGDANQTMRTSLLDP